MRLGDVLSTVLGQAQGQPVSSPRAGVGRAGDRLAQEIRGSAAAQEPSHGARHWSIFAELRTARRHGAVAVTRALPQAKTFSPQPLATVA